MRARTLRPLGAALILLFTVTPARAQSPGDDVRMQARWHFHRGLSLFNQGDNAGALAEFRRAHDLIPNPRVSYNMGLTYAALGSPIEAVETLEPLLASSALSSEQRAHVQTVLEEQRLRIGRVTVLTNVPGAVVEIDGIAAGRAPLPEPLRVAVGRRLVAVSAPGHLPRRSAVLIAGSTLHELRLDLEPSELRVATLAIASNVPDVEVSVDGQPAGTTPLAAPLTFAPGPHVVRAVRTGYRPVTRSVELGPGVTGKLELALEVDPAALQGGGGRLELSISEPQAEVFIDGVPQGARQSSALPPGRHALRVERAGFFPAERLITISPRHALALRVELFPTPEYRASYARAVSRQRAWAYGVGGGGLVVLGASAGFLIWNENRERDAERDFDAIADSFGPDGACDTQVGLPPATRGACEATLEQRLADLEDVRSREKYGWIGAGVGAAAAGVGLYLLLSSEDPARYDPQPESDVFGSLAPELIWQPGWRGIGASGRF